MLKPLRVLTGLRAVATCLAIVFSCNSTHGAEIKCAGSNSGIDTEKLDDSRPEIHRPADQCIWIEITGVIESGDSKKVAKFFEQAKHVSVVYLRSPGGNVQEAIAIGRMLRNRFIVARPIPFEYHLRSPGLKMHCGTSGTPPCCISACALLYFGSAQWFEWDFVGLHRPTLAELGEVGYDDAKAAISEAKKIIAAYLDDLDIDRKIYEIIERTPPENVAIVEMGKLLEADETGRIYPSTIRDWLRSKCWMKAERARGDCMSDQLNRQQSSKFSAANKKAEPKHKEQQDLERDAAKLTLTQSIAALSSGCQGGVWNGEHFCRAVGHHVERLILSMTLPELNIAEPLLRSEGARTNRPYEFDEKTFDWPLRERRRALHLAEEKTKIRMMDQCSVEMYLSDLWQSEVPEEKLDVFKYAQDRYEELTGKEWSEKSRQSRCRD